MNTLDWAKQLRDMTTEQIIAEIAKDDDSVTDLDSAIKHVEITRDEFILDRDAEGCAYVQITLDRLYELEGEYVHARDLLARLARVLHVRLRGDRLRRAVERARDSGRQCPRHAGVRPAHGTRSHDLGGLVLHLPARGREWIRPRGRGGRGQLGHAER